MRDFFYNKGDVLIAILIILAAVFVIYMRVGVIMDYSATGKGGSSVLPSLSSIFTGDTEEPAENPANEPIDANDTSADIPPVVEPVDSAGDAADEQPADEPAVYQEEPVQEPPPEPEPPPSGEMQITVNAGDSGGAIADKLIAAGAITDKQGWIDDLIAAGADTKVKQGTFKIPAGSTHADIIAILIK